MWRSDDGGAHWRLMTRDTLVNQRPFYMSRLAVDPAQSQSRLLLVRRSHRDARRRQDLSTTLPERRAPRPSRACGSRATGGASSKPTTAARRSRSTAARRGTGDSTSSSHRFTGRIRRREPVSRLRRHAGQRLVLRTVRFAQPLWASTERRLARRRQRRRRHRGCGPSPATRTRFGTSASTSSTVSSASSICTRGKTTTSRRTSPTLTVARSLGCRIASNWEAPIALFAATAPSAISAPTCSSKRAIAGVRGRRSAPILRATIRASSRSRAVRSTPTSRVRSSTTRSRHRAVAVSTPNAFGSVPTTDWCSSRPTAERTGTTLRRPASPPWGRIDTVEASRANPQRAYVVVDRHVDGRSPALTFSSPTIRARRGVRSPPGCRPINTCTSCAKTRRTPTSYTPDWSRGCGSRSTAARTGRACG